MAPLLEGAGTRLKIVEAWSQGKAVVTTAKGVEGLPSVPGTVAIADAAQGFAAHVQSLLTDAERRRAMGAAALEVFRQRLSWEVARRTVSAGSIVAGVDRTPEPTRVAT